MIPANMTDKQIREALSLLYDSKRQSEAEATGNPMCRVVHDSRLQQELFHEMRRCNARGEQPMNYALFLDDERFPPDDGRKWVVARSSEQALRFIKTFGWPEYVSFDHDLGGEDTAMKFVRPVLDMLLDEDRQIPFGWFVHSQNPVGRDNISALLTSFGRM